MHVLPAWRARKDRHLELLGGQADGRIAEPGLAMHEVELECAERQGFDRLGSAVPDRGADARFELRHPERLRDIVIRSAVECGDLSIFAAVGREDDDRHVTPLADSPAHREPVDIREAEVEHDDIRGGAARSVIFLRRR